jgi:hypothetical protein
VCFLASVRDERRTMHPCSTVRDAARTSNFVGEASSFDELLVFLCSGLCLVYCIEKEKEELDRWGLIVLFKGFRWYCVVVLLVSLVVFYVPPIHVFLWCHYTQYKV